MGGHQSKQSVDMSTSLITNAVMNITQDCQTTINSNQIMNQYGTGNVFKGNVQRSTISINQKCLSKMNQSGEFSNKISSAIAQEMKDQTVALTQWADAGKDSQSTRLHNAVTTNITFNDVQNCAVSIDKKQIMNQVGNDQIMEDQLQESVTNVMKTCLMSGGQTANVANDITNTVNQHSEYKSENPLNFIADTFRAIGSSIMSVVYLIIIFIVGIVVVLFFIGGGGKKKKKPDDSEPSAEEAPQREPEEMSQREPEQATARE